MNKTNIKSLIETLSDELQPVRPFAHPLVRIMPWFVLAFAYVAGVSYYLGIRHDWAEQITSSPTFIFENALALIVMIVSGAAASWLCVPDMRGNRWLISTSFALVGAFALFTLIRAVTEGVYIHTFNFGHCFGDGMLMGFVPSSLIIWMLRRGRTTRPFLLSTMSLLSVGSLGYIGLRFTCSMDVIGHSALYHLFPFVVAGGVVGGLARRIYKW